MGNCGLEYKGPEYLNIRRSDGPTKDLVCTYVKHCTKEVSILFLSSPVSYSLGSKVLKFAENAGLRFYQKKNCTSVSIGKTEELKPVKILYILTEREVESKDNLLRGGLVD